MIFITIIFIFILLLSKFLKEFKLGRYLILLITYIIVLIVFGKLTYTPDWEGYEFLITEPNKLDLIFRIISNYAVNKGYTYKDVHFFHIAITSIFLLWFISIYSKNVFLVTIIYLCLLFLFYATTIRFFIGYYAGLLALYYFLFKKQRLLAIILFIFAFLNHSSLLLLLIYIPLFNIKLDRLFKIVFIIATISFVLIFVLSSFYNIDMLLYGENKYSIYFKTEGKSSIFGGIALFLPYVFFLPFLKTYYFKCRNALTSNTKKRQLDFLFRLTIIPYSLLGIAVYFQIIGHRFIIASILIPILLLFIIMSSNKNKMKSKLIFYSYIVFILLYNYVLLPSLTSSAINNIVLRMLNSNSFIQYFLF